MPLLERVFIRKMPVFADVHEARSSRFDARVESKGEGAEDAKTAVGVYCIHSLEKLRLGGLWNVYGKDCSIFAGSASVSGEYKDVTIRKSKHNILEEQYRNWHDLMAKGQVFMGDLTVGEGYVLKSGIYYVDGDIHFYGTASGPVTMLCTGKIVMDGHGVFLPAKENVLLMARRSVYILGEGAEYRGMICSLEGQVRVLGDRMSFADGGLWGRRIGIYGSNNLFTYYGRK